MRVSTQIFRKIFIISCLVLPAAGFTMTTPGSEVSSIEGLSNISTWQALDQRRLLLSLGQKQDYLVTLARVCHALPFATQLGVSASNNTTYAGFDYITADGERCAIKAINRLSKEEKQVLTKV
jgi:hypothetical protein